MTEEEWICGEDGRKREGRVGENEGKRGKKIEERRWPRRQRLKFRERGASVSSGGPSSRGMVAERSVGGLASGLNSRDNIAPVRRDICTIIKIRDSGSNRHGDITLVRANQLNERRERSPCKTSLLASSCPSRRLARPRGCAASSSFGQDPGWTRPLAQGDSAA